jgi:hypothetical protein
MGGGHSQNQGPRTRWHVCMFRFALCFMMGEVHGFGDIPHTRGWKASSLAPYLKMSPP